MMKKQFSRNMQLKVFLLILISTMLVSCNAKTVAPTQDSLGQTSSAQELSGKTKASTQNDSDQSTIFQELGGKDEVEPLNNPDQLAIPQGLLGQWEIIESYSSGEESAINPIGVDLEILNDGNVLFSLDSGYGFNVSVLKLIILPEGRLLFHNTTSGYGIAVFFKVNENQLKLSLGDDYHLYGRKASN